MCHRVSLSILATVECFTKFSVLSNGCCCISLHKRICGYYLVDLLWWYEWLTNVHHLLYTSFRPFNTGSNATVRYQLVARSILPTFFGAKTAHIVTSNICQPYKTLAYPERATVWYFLRATSKVCIATSSLLKHWTQVFMHAFKQ